LPYYTRTRYSSEVWYSLAAVDYTGYGRGKWGQQEERRKGAWSSQSVWSCWELKDVWNSVPLAPRFLPCAQVSQYVSMPLQAEFPPKNRHPTHDLPTMKVMVLFIPPFWSSYLLLLDGLGSKVKVLI